MPGSAPARKGSSSSSADTPPTKRVKHSGGRDESSDGSCPGGGASGTAPYGSSATSTLSSSINASGDASAAAAIAVAAGTSTADGFTTMDVAQQRASGYDQQTAAIGDANVSSATSAAVPPQPLLCRWEEIMLADTLRFSLDPAVARAKRVLHLGELEKELREEAPQNKTWSLDSRTLFDRLVFGRLNHTGLGRIGGGGGGVGMDDEKDAMGGSPLAYMVASYERAVQVGKGPAPRSKGISVGEKRDAALRHLRDVLVSYAILTIQNPDMWGDDDDEAGSRPTPTDELKSLFKQKGAAALPQGLLDDFIRRASPASSSGAGDGEVADDEEITLEDLFQPLLLSLLREAKELVGRSDPTASAGEFATVVQALAALVERKPLAGLFARLPEWIPQTACSGKALEEKSPLGILFAFKATRACFEVGAMDLVVSGAQWSRERKATREEGQALGTVLKSCRAAMSTVRGALLGLLTTLLKAKQAREPVLQWLAAVANHNRSRERDGFHQGFEDLPVSSAGMLANVLWALLKLCEPFLTLGDLKAEALAAKTDLDYFHGSDRIDVSDDTVLWSEDAEEATEEGSSGDRGTSSSRRWIDQRNESRRAQFEAARATMLSLGGEQTAGSGVGSEMEDVGEEEHEEEVDPKEKTFGTTAEYAGLAARVLHVGVGQAQRLFSATNRKMERWRDARNGFKRQLEQEAESRSDHRRTLEKRVKRLQLQLEAGALTRLTLQLVDMDPDIVLPSLRFLRFQGGRLMKHASVGRGVTRNALGEPMPPLPMPPPPRFAALPAHLMEDVADMIKFAAYTCPPDPRSGLPPLDLISHPEASAFLSFLVLFLGTSGYMRNPYIRAKMVEALVAFMPAEEEKGRSRRGKDPFESLFLGHPMARELLGPQLFDFFVDIELTGSHTQFYDKFTFRSLTAQLLEYLWTLQPYRESIIRYSEDNNKFVRFANMLINDSIYHTDEAIKFLSAIKVAQHRAADESLSEDERKEARDEAEHSGRSAKYCLKEATLLLRMLAYLSESIKDAFMVDELRARTAQMLGYFLDHLVGKKSKDLKVDNMAELGWRPREVLGTLVDIYMKLSACERFAEAVAADERSYKREIFVRAGDVISKVPSDGSPVCEPREVQAFRAFADTVEEKHVELSREFEELGDIPDRFMCPIGCDIMRDPVTLPTSGQVMDRQSITRHLLSDPQDPFSRKPLTVEMLEPNDALREEIEEWIREQRRRAKEEKASRGDGDTKGGDEKASAPADALPPPPPPAEKRDTSPPALEHSGIDVPFDGGAQAGDGSEGLSDQRSSRDGDGGDGGGGEHVRDNKDGDRDRDDDGLGDNEEALLLQQALALSLEGAISGGSGDDGGQQG